MGRSTSGHDNTAPQRSRRAMLTGGAAGALGMIAFETLAKTPPAQAAGTLTGGVFSSGVAFAAVTLSQSGGSVAVDASQGNVFTLALTASGWTIANPANALADGQVIRIRLTQDSAGGRTVSWGSASNSAPTLSTTPSATDMLSFEYVAALSQWCYQGAVFPQNYGGVPKPLSISVVQSIYVPFNVEGNFSNPIGAGNSVVLI